MSPNQQRNSEKNDVQGLHVTPARAVPHGAAAHRGAQAAENGDHRRLPASSTVLQARKAARERRSGASNTVLQGCMASWHVRRERVRFRDCDSMGHVNNAVYSTFLDESRIEGRGGLADFILARGEIDFRSELRAGEEIEVRTRCARVG